MHDVGNDRYMYVTMGDDACALQHTEGARLPLAGVIKFGVPIFIITTSYISREICTKITAVANHSMIE